MIDLVDLMSMPYARESASAVLGAVAMALIGGLPGWVLAKVKSRAKGFATRVTRKRCVRFEGDRPVAACANIRTKVPYWRPPSKFGITDKASAKRWVKGKK